MPSTRRALLAAISSCAVSVGLAGCSESGRTDATTADRTPSATAAPSETASPDASPSPTSASDGRLALPSVVTSGGLPDGSVPLKREETISFVNFFTTWCKPCRREMPAFRELRAAYTPDELHMVSVTPEVDAELIRSFWAEYNGTWPVVNDPELRASTRWDVGSYPTNLLFDASGDPAGADGAEVQTRSFEGLSELVDDALADQ